MQTASDIVVTTYIYLQYYIQDRSQLFYPMKFLLKPFNLLYNVIPLKRTNTVLWDNNSRALFLIESPQRGDSTEINNIFYTYIYYVIHTVDMIP